jgi:hypothetical protein
MKADRFVIRPKLLVALASLALPLLAAGVAAQQAPKENPYPEHGKVIATRLGAEAVGSAGIVGSLKGWVYRVIAVTSTTIFREAENRLSPSAKMLLSELKSKKPIWTTARTANVITLSEPESPIRSRVPNKTRDTGGCSASEMGESERTEKSSVTV